MSSPPENSKHFTDEFLAGAYRRIQTAIVVCFAIAAIPVFWKFGRAAGLGLLLGALAALINFIWLRKSMEALTAKIANQQQEQPSKFSLMMRFVFRYALLATVAYVIIFSSAVSGLGVLVGLLFSVPALLFEAGYEAYVAIRHGE